MHFSSLASLAVLLLGTAVSSQDVPVEPIQSFQIKRPASEMMGYPTGVFCGTGQLVLHGYEDGEGQQPDFLQIDALGTLRCVGLTATFQVSSGTTAKQILLIAPPVPYDISASGLKPAYWKYDGSTLRVSPSSYLPSRRKRVDEYILGFDSAGNLIAGSADDITTSLEPSDVVVVPPTSSSTIPVTIASTTEPFTSASSTDVLTTTTTSNDLTSSASSSDVLTISVSTEITSSSASPSSNTLSPAIVTTDSSSAASLSTEPTSSAPATVTSTTTASPSIDTFSPAPVSSSSASDSLSAGVTSVAESVTSVVSSASAAVPSTTAPAPTSDSPTVPVSSSMSSSPTLPVATATTTYALSASGTPLICSGTVITLAPAATFAPSLITIDSNGVLACEGKQGYLKLTAPGSANYDVVLYTPPPPAGQGIETGYFSLASGSLVAQFSPFMRRRRRQTGALPVGLGPGGTLIAGPGVTPITGTPIGSTGGASGSGGLSSTPSPSPTGPTLILSSSAANSNGIAPISVSTAIPGTVTSTVTLTVPGTTQTVVAVQVFVNGIPVGFGTNGINSSSGHITIVVFIGNVVTAVYAGGLAPVNLEISSGARLFGNVAPVIVNVIVMVAPLVHYVDGTARTTLTTVSGYITATASGPGLVPGAGAVTLVNAAPITTILATQTIAVPGVNAAGATVVPNVGPAGVTGVVVPPGAVPGIAAAAGNQGANGVSGLPAASGAAGRSLPVLSAGITAFFCVLLMI